MPRQLTVRGVPEEVGRRLESLSRAKGKSVNALVLEILANSVGVAERRQRLARYVTWTAEDVEQFNDALAAQRPHDDPRWK
jgi:plasmid stability protein